MTQITVKVVGADIVRQGLQDLEAQIPKIGRKGIYDMMVRVRSRLAQKPRRPSYPINWDSEKQRRYVLALLRRKDNLPYKPTGRYESNWKIIKRERGYMLENNAPMARYLSGDYTGAGQSNIHAGRRLVFMDVVDEEIKGLDEEIDRSISYYGRSKRLIP